MVTARRKSKDAEAVRSELAALRAKRETLYDSVRGFAGDVGESASAKYDEALRSAEDMTERALGLAEDAMAQAGKAAAQAIGDVEDWASDSADYLRDTVRAQPLQVLLLSLGIGALLGALFFYRPATDRERRRPRKRH